MMLRVALASIALVLVPGTAWAQVRCPGTRLDVLAPPISSEPYVQLQIGQRTGPFLIDYAATESSVEPAIWGPSSGGSMSLSGPAWPGVPGTNTYRTLARNVRYRGVGQQHGVIGTDIL